MKKGFTLIELLVVVLIIGILAAIALPQYTKAVNKSRAAAMMAKVGTLQSAVEMYKLEHNAFPSFGTPHPTEQQVSDDLGIDIKLEKNMTFTIYTAYAGIRYDDGKTQFL
ncbi:prepilin-type N-terminal cleavage/methylation domain-containing protein [Elusimicrobium simillimum]|uniref:type IV pilin protein n=1 Tax=Elusimicrobium simillimum TaxID=3143438 RepID=UPI003C6F4A48